MGPKTRDRRSAMTAEEARTFDRHSSENAEILRDAAALHGCDYRPYEDWFTYHRWQAQGMQVQKDERGIKLAVIVHGEKAEVSENGDGEQQTRPVSYRRMSAVFCRCQVKPKEQRP